MLRREHEKQNLRTRVITVSGEKYYREFRTEKFGWCRADRSHIVSVEANVTCDEVVEKSNDKRR